MKVIQLESVDSTNQYIKENYSNLNDLDVVSTKKQIKGKGRHSNGWFSSKDSLTFSILLKDNLNQENISLLPLFMAKVLHQVISRYENEVSIKWPNDLYILDKKLSGILVETIYQTHLDAIIIGVGINVNNIEFPNEIKNQVISLKQATNKTYSLDKLLNEIFDQLKSNMNQLSKDSQIIIDYCNDYHILNNENISFEHENTIKTGKCLKINNNGHLLVRKEDEIISLFSGAVHKINKQ